MKRWEYQMKIINNVVFEEHLNVFGADGWELAHFQYQPNQDRTLLIFKRPLPIQETE